MPTWYTAVPPLEPKPDLPTPSASQLASLIDRAAGLLKADAEKYKETSVGQSASDAHFLKTVLATGTLSDRLSALTLLVQASPVHNTAALETLRAMAQKGRAKGGRDEGMKAVRCVVDWWVGGGGPGRKLRYFRDQPLLHPGVDDAHLMIWYFEDWLKKYFFSILQILETFSLDPLTYVRTQTLAFLSTLLRAQPEQEQNLLRLLVNKLGDTEKAVCSRASYHLLQILQAHPAMKGVIVREVRSLIFRLPASTAAQAAPASSEAKHIRFGDADASSSKSKAKDAAKKEGAPSRWNTHAWYYSAVTLNQIVLTPSAADRAVARLLVDMYFEMFEEILGSKGEEDEGSDREGEEGKEEKKGPAGKAAKGKGKGTPKDKKKKVKEVKGAAGFAEVEDSSSRLIGAILTGVNRALPFAQMHLSSDSAAVFQKHIDTLFRITHTSTFNISLQALTLILQISTTLSSPSTKPSTSSQSSAFSTSLRDRFYRSLYASLIDPRLATSNKQALYLNLVFKALKADHDAQRAAAFVRRFVQVLASGVGAGGAVEFVAGGLYLLGELFSTTPALKQLLSLPKSKATPPPDAPTYDPRKRDPQYAHAFASPMYELLPLLNHFHPTISLHASQLFTSSPITGSPDLSLNTLSHFLDRFVYKNPKKPKPKGSSAMQPGAAPADPASGVKLVKGEAAGMDVPVYDERFWKRRVEDVPVDQRFFHAYFTRKAEKERQKAAKVGRRKGKGGDEGSDVGEGSDEDEEALEDEQEGESGSEEEEEEAEDIEGGSESEDGGFDLSTKGQKPAPAESDEEEEDSDAEEAEIWKAMKATMPAELEDDDLMNDSDDSDDESDDVPSDLDALESDEEIEAAKSKAKGDAEADSDAGEDDDDAFSLVEGSDAEDLLPLDAEVPMGLIEYDGSDAGSDAEGGDDGEGWGGISSEKKPQKGKRKRDEEGGRRAQRKKLRALPTFASYEDYAKLIEDGPEDNI
ncbi:CBF-domain-containing protein [Trametes coccinea BRFM310]|uniref:CBF-domain-containing protein n=1 Tax=Trametes coccinea (strain BRFM310) TaxID=1353009 RepID=A0A1Y2IGT8_TRAC3|nr:CBF-domain-containing protein [Trametes coccinea BRFM310]